VIGTLSASQMSVKAFDVKGQALDLNVDAAASAKGDARVKRDVTDEAAVVYTGEKPVVFAVEVLRLEYWRSDGTWHFDELAHMGKIRDHEEWSEDEFLLEVEE
jgi:hypothetical protein